ncbi:MAG: replicative DNA helicase, partial [Acinetobacter sp.]|nr:replicative DNA helicase [Acinetobacter sp.]
DGGSVTDIIGKAETAIFGLSQQSIKGGREFKRMDAVLKTVLNDMEALIDSPPKTGVRGLSTSFVDLDALTSGLLPGHLIYLAARPSMGKSTLAMNIVEHVGLSLKVPTAVFSLEMNASELVERTLASLGGVPLNAIKEPWTLDDANWSMLSLGVTKITDHPVFIDDSPGLTMSGLRSRALRLNSEIQHEFNQPLGLIVVDYLQLMAADGRTDTRNNQIEDISRGLKQLAKDLRIPVIVLSQLNRDLERRLISGQLCLICATQDR